MSMLGEYLLQSGQLYLDCLALHAKVDHPRGRQALMEDQLAEVRVVGDEDSSFVSGNLKHCLIINAAGEVKDDGLDVVTQGLKKVSNPKFCTLVQQEVHRPGTGAVSGVCREARTRLFFSTSTLAYSRQALTSSTVSLG